MELSTTRLVEVRPRLVTCRKGVGLRGVVRCRAEGENLSSELQRLRRENAELRKQIATLTATAPKKTGAKKRSPVKKERDGIQWPSPNESPPFWTRAAKHGVERTTLITGGAEIVMKDPPDAKSLYVVHMTAEMAPIAKVELPTSNRKSERDVTGWRIGRCGDGIGTRLVGERPHGGSLLAVLRVPSQ